MIEESGYKWSVADMCSTEMYAQTSDLLQDYQLTEQLANY